MSVKVDWLCARHTLVQIARNNMRYDTDVHNGRLPRGLSGSRSRINSLVVSVADLPGGTDPGCHLRLMESKLCVHGVRP